MVRVRHEDGSAREKFVRGGKDYIRYLGDTEWERGDEYRNLQSALACVVQACAVRIPRNVRLHGNVVLDTGSDLRRDGNGNHLLKLVHVGSTVQYCIAVSLTASSVGTPSVSHAPVTMGLRLCKHTRPLASVSNSQLWLFCDTAVFTKKYLERV